MKPFCLHCEKLTKIADRPLVNEITFTARSGEIHAIIGNNGEGKTVFTQLLAGVRPFTSGALFLDDEKLRISNVIDAQKYGIYMLQQEASLFSQLCIRDNMIIGNEQALGGSRFWAPSTKKQNELCRKYLKLFGLEDLDLTKSVEKLNPMERLCIQLCRILICQPKVLILDEPSTSLTVSELRILFQFLEEFKRNAVVILVTHNYSLLLRYCDQISIIDNGSLAATFERKDFQSPEFQKYITHMKMDFAYPSVRMTPGAELLCSKNLSSATIKNLSFSLHEGEIIGIAGLKTDDRQQLIKLLLNDKKPDTGTLSFPGTKEHPSINLISGMDICKSLFMTQSVPFNIVASDFHQTLNHGFFSSKKMNFYGARYLKKLNVKDADIKTHPSHLSTGTKQKVLLARALFQKSNIYIYDEPSRNLDSVSKLDLYNLLNSLALKGSAILLISSDYAELIGMCNRIILVRDGVQIGNYITDYLSIEALSKELE